MAKYDWKQLEKEYILSDHKSVSSFLKDKGIKQNGSTKNRTKGWKNKKVLKEEKKSTKTIEKVIEKEAEKEAQQIADLKSIANDLALNILKANSQLEQYIVKNKKKTKKVKFDYEVGKPKEETITENEKIEVMENGIIDRHGLKMLTSALRDLKEIISPKPELEDEDNSFIEALEGKTEDIWNEEKE